MSFVLFPLLEKSPLLAQELSENGSREVTSGVLPRVQASVQLCEQEGRKINRQPVVLLRRLSQRELSSVRLPAAQISGDESSQTFRTSKKRRRLEQKDEKLDTTSVKAVKDVQTKASTERRERTVVKGATPAAKNKGSIPPTSATQNH